MERIPRIGLIGLGIAALAGNWGPLRPAQAGAGADAYSPAMMRALAGQIAFDGATFTPGEQWDIYTVAQQGVGVTDLTPDPIGSQFNPAWSPDGRRIAFGSDVPGPYLGIDVMNADGTGQTQLITGSLNPGEPSWSPDGSRIAFDQRGPSGDYDVFVMDSDGSNVVQLTTDPMVDHAPAWSPDGQHIAFTSSRTGADHIYVMNPDGTAQTQLTFNDAEEHATWSPDSSRIAYEKYSVDPPRSEIYSMRSDGTGQTQITHVGNVDAPAWSPDGRAIAFMELRETGWAISIVTTDGSHLFRLPQHTYQDGSPSWQPITPASCTITGTAGDDALVGTAGNDVICGLVGNDQIFGLEGNDVVVAGPGDDQVTGGPGDDTLLGAEGADRLWGQGGRDLIRAVGAGADRVDGGSGRDVCLAGPEDTTSSCP